MTKRLFHQSFPINIKIILAHIKGSWFGSEPENNQCSGLNLLSDRHFLKTEEFTKVRIKIVNIKTFSVANFEMNVARKPQSFSVLVFL